VIDTPCMRVSPGHGAERLAATTSDASTLLDGSVLPIVADLEGHDLSGLRRHWRAHLGGEPPTHLPRWLLMRVLAYRLQSDAFGGLDKSIQRMLPSKRDDDAAAPFERRAPQTREGVGLKAGALLVREWKGRLERVMILEEGFGWNGQTFRSLSQIAKAMTGTNWNGHRFFGLRQGKPAANGEERRRRKKRGPLAATAALGASSGDLPP
jgi:Protein of unknown function (DUF2924)